MQLGYAVLTCASSACTGVAGHQTGWILHPANRFGNGACQIGLTDLLEMPVPPRGGYNVKHRTMYCGSAAE